MKYRPRIWMWENVICASHTPIKNISDSKNENYKNILTT